MPMFLIEKDSSTKIPKDCSEEDAQSFLEQGFGVQRIGENGELLPFAAGVAEAAEAAEEATEAPADDAPAAAPAPARKTTAKKRK